MVGVMGAVGDRTGISGFYISFVLAPLASNASELIAAFNYSLKKTSRTIVISFAALQVRSGVSPSISSGLGLSPFSQIWLCHASLSFVGLQYLCVLFF